LNWIDQYTICDNWLNGWKIIQGDIFWRKFSSCYSKTNFEIFFKFSCFFHLSSWIDWYIVCGNQFIRWKVVSEGIFSQKFPGRSLEWNVELFNFSTFLACQPELIGMMIVIIGQTVKCFEGGVHKSSTCSPEWNFENFDAFILFPLSWWIDQYTICENRSSGWKVIWGGIFFTKMPCLLR
jgi:hypothetical protein